MHCGLEKGKVKMPFSSGEIQDIAELNCSFNSIRSCHPCGWSCVDDDVSQKASLRLELRGDRFLLSLGLRGFKGPELWGDGE